MIAEGSPGSSTGTGATVLVVEDEAHLAAGLKLNLELDGYRAVIARSVREAGAQLLQAAPDLVLLDVMLPDGDGYSFCRQLREAGHYMPVIMLTARSAAEDRVLGLDSGADDYMPKPFELPELLARVRSALRRSGWRQAGAALADRPLGALRFGEAVIDFDTHEATAFGKPLRLTQLELDLVRYFSQHPGRVLSREELLERVWKLRNAPNTRSVDNFIARLRKLFEREPDKPVHFVSHRGAGYRFVPDGDLRT